MSEVGVHLGVVPNGQTVPRIPDAALHEAHRRIKLSMVLMVHRRVLARSIAIRACDKMVVSAMITTQIPSVTTEDASLSELGCGVGCTGCDACVSVLCAPFYVEAIICPDQAAR